MSIAAISRLYCRTCKEETLHQSGICGCGARFVALPVRTVPMHELMTFNYQQFKGSRPPRSK
jgi:hypothetical protein